MKKFLCIVLLAAMCTAFTFPVCAGNDETGIQTAEHPISGEEAQSYFEQAMYVVLSKYRFDISKEEMYEAALNYLLQNNPELLEDAFTGLFDSLDEHSVYYTDEQLKSFITNISGELCGVGVLVMTVDEGLFVSNVYDNTPAKEAGLKSGDIITAVDGMSLAGVDISIAQQHILGEENTPVRLTVKRNGTTFDIVPLRRKVVIDSGMYQIIENGTIGYIALNEFNEKASEFIQKALDEFDSADISNIILDLRNNPGGSLYEYADVCNFFIPAGPVIHLDFKNPLKNFTLYSENNNVRYNLIVLLNENSASASEAFSAAVQDTGVGIVVGQKSYGKGTMQNITKFNIGGGIKLTEAEYLSPGKRSINGKGVIPDCVVTDKVTSYRNSDFEKITYDRKMKSGDTGKDVLAIEQRLVYLGYLNAIADETFDQKTHDAVMSFQGLNGLYEYGVMDITTQLELESQLSGLEITNDSTLKKAIDIYTHEDWKNYRFDSTDK